MDEKKSCASCSYFEMNLGKPRGEWYACSLHKVYIVDDSQAETCPDFWKIFTPKPDHLNALGVSRHDREWADASNLLHESEGRDED